MVVKVLGRERGDRWGVGCGTLIIRGWGWGGWRQQECSHILTKGVPEWSLYTSHILTRVVRVLTKGVPPNTHRDVPEGKVHKSTEDVPECRRCHPYTHNIPDSFHALKARGISAADEQSSEGGPSSST